MLKFNLRNVGKCPSNLQFSCNLQHALPSLQHTQVSLAAGRPVAMDLSWFSQPAKQFYGRCTHWQSASGSESERAGKNLCQHAAVSHTQHALIHAISESGLLRLTAIFRVSCQSCMPMKLKDTVERQGACILAGNIKLSLLLFMASLASQPHVHQHLALLSAYTAASMLEAMLQHIAHMH